MPRTQKKITRKKPENSSWKPSGRAVLPIAVIAAGAGVVLLAIYFNRKNMENEALEDYDIDVENYEVKSSPMISPQQ